MFQSICASKLYRASTRKDRIKAAFDDPINAELVGQLATALDEEYKTPDYLVKEEVKEHALDQEAVSSEPAADDSEGVDNPTSPSPHRSNPSDLGSQVSNEVDQPSEESPESTGQDPSESTTSESSPSSAPEASAGPEPVVESTSIKGDTIVGSRVRNMFRDMRQVAEQIKGMLNFKDSTTGVNRILCKEGELWIYYNDDVNLNNVMAEVIELLNASNYTYLEFNRLARSDNAIVFLIDFADSQNVIVSDPANKNQ